MKKEKGKVFKQTKRKRFIKKSGLIGYLKYLCCYIGRKNKD